MQNARFLNQAASLAVGVAGLAALLGTAGCYHPDVPSGRFTCSLADPECPDGLTCVEGACITPGATQVVRAADITITKTGPAYTGPTMMLNWTDATMCVDEGAEPNDGPDPYGQPLSWSPTLDNPAPPTISNKAICPTGANTVISGNTDHDVDFFKVDLSQASGQVTLVANLTYDIQYGDLDIAIYDHLLTQLVADGTAVANGCVSTTVSPGVYYVVVAGANNTDINNFSVQIATYSSAHACGATTSP